MSLEWDSFGGRLGCPAGLGRHPLMGKPHEACVQKGSDDRANDRGGHVQPGIAEIAGRDHRAERARWVERGTRKGSAHEDIEGQRHSYRERRKIAGAACNRRTEDDRDQEKAEKCR